MISDHSDIELTANGLIIEQPESGYRSSLDPVLLSRFASVKGREKVLDLGCGVGVILLRLACQAPGAEFTGVDIQPEMVQLAEKNVIANGLQKRVRIITADLCEPMSGVAHDSFDVVVTNPPFRALGTGRTAPDKGRAIARHEISGGLPEFLLAASRAMKTGGRFYIVFLAERLAELLADMRSLRIEPKRLRTVHSRAGEPARLVLVEGRKNGKPGLTVEAPLIVYAGPGRSYCPEVLEMYQ